MKTLLLSSAVLLVGAPRVVAADIFFDDFERGAGRWHLPSRQWSVVDGVGLDGSRALQLEYRKGETPVWIERNDMVRVEPGEAYRIEAWVNDSAFHAKESSVSISLAVYDEKGDLIRGVGAGASRVIDNVIRKDRFYCVEGTTRPLPANAAKARFYIWAKEGSYGKVLFDGFRAYSVAVNPLVDLCCSAYRNEAAEGEVRFSAGYAVNEMKHDMKRIHAELRYVSPKGEEVVVATLSDGVASATLPVSSFMYGTHTVHMLLKEGDKQIGESSCDFTRHARLPVRRVYFDELNRTVVDGEPFFPLGIYFDDITADDIAVCAKASFNCIMPYKRPDEAKMDVCEAAGIKVIVPVTGFYEVQTGTNVQLAAEYDAKYIRGMVERFRLHPATLAWYLADELTAPYAGLLEVRKKMCHEKDPDHPTWVCLNRPWNVRLFVNGYDAVGMDPYPIGNPSSFGSGTIAQASEWAQAAQQGMYRSRAMWQVPQAFDWAYYAAKRVVNKSPDMRMPTRDEMRSMTWQAIACGANGIIYYYFEDAYRRGGTKEENERRWADLCAVVREVKEKVSVLLSDPGPVVEDVPENLVCRTWKAAECKVHLLVCNTTRTAVNGSVRIGSIPHSIDLPPIGVVMREL